MNVIDCMAIAPYYLTLFFMPQPEMGPIDPAIPTGTVYRTLSCRTNSPYRIWILHIGQETNKLKQLQYNQVKSRLYVGPGVTTDEPQQEGGFGDVGRIMQVRLIGLITVRIM